MEQPKFSPELNQETENPKRTRLLRWYMEKKVLGSDPVLDDPSEAEEMFSDMQTIDKVNLLYEKVQAKQEAEKEYGDADPYILREIQALWADEAVQNMAGHRFKEALKDKKAYELSDLGQNWDALNIVIDLKEKEYQAVSRKLFLKQFTRPDELSVANSKASHLAKQLIQKREEREDILALKEMPHTLENTDTVALIQFDRLRRMREQAETTGFVWLPSREKIYAQTVASLQNGRWPVLKGEAGTGKSELADAAARALTGEDPTHVPCGPRTSERELISDKEIDPQTGGSYDAYKALLQAATGYEDSRQTEPNVNQGRIVRFDEINRLDQSGSAYSLIKAARQLRPGSAFFGKTVLPGFSAIGTSNPPGPRYPDRSEFDAAMRREVAEIDVDYPPMDHEDPELYEFMLAMLMDKNGHIAVAKEELEPAYSVGEMGIVPHPVSETDSRMVVGDQMVSRIGNLPEHGFLWRLAYAVRAVQNAFLAGNVDTANQHTLRFKVDTIGTYQIVETGGESLTLHSSTITLGEIASWMRGFNDRTQKDDAEFHTKSLSEWIAYKISTYIQHADEADRDKLFAIFEYYIRDTDDSVPEYKQPLTPKEIGYLSPRIPKPWILKNPESERGVELHDNVEVMLEDGSMINVSKEGYAHHNDQHDIQYLHPNGETRFSVDGEEYEYVGVAGDDTIVARINPSDPESNLHRKFTISGLKLDLVFTREEESKQEHALTEEDVRSQVTSLRSTLYQAGIVEKSGSTFLLKGADGRQYSMPNAKQVFEHIERHREYLQEKIDQGFTKIMLVPIAAPLDTLLGGLTELLNSAAGPTVRAEKVFQARPDTWINFNQVQPVVAQANLLALDESAALRYYPTHGYGVATGVLKSTLLENLQGTPGWEILLVQDLAVIPGEHDVQVFEEGGREPIRTSEEDPTKGAMGHFAVRASNEVPSPDDYTGLFRNSRTDNPYKREKGLTIEAWIVMAMQKFMDKGEVLDDFGGEGKMSYLIGSNAGGAVPVAYFDRGTGSFTLGTIVSNTRSRSAGIRTSVSVPTALYSDI